MKQLDVGRLKFLFENGLQVSQYDKWSFYRNQFQQIARGSKGVDFVCLTDCTAWLVEVTDYRGHPLPKAPAIAEELATKVRDTLAGLAAATKNANEECERDFALCALKKRRRWRVALHLEQPAMPKHRFAFNLANLMVLLKKRRWLKAVDARPVVCSRGSTPPSAPWTVK